MRIIDEATEQEIFDPDLTAGYLYEQDWVAPEYYERQKAEGLPAVLDEWYEHVQMYHVWTPEEIAQREEAERQAARQQRIDGLPEEVDALDVQHDAYAAETDIALFDLDAAQATYETDTDAALFDLAEYAASLEARIAALEG